MQELEVFVIVDEDGSYVANIDQADALEAANDAGLVACRRLIRVVLNVPTPCPIEVQATLPVETSEATVSVK